jgi:D-aminopeptidase
MRVHVISDIEGVAGVVKPEQSDGGEPLFEEARRLYTEEINAAVRGAFAGGATEVVVMDCHGAGKGWTFNSLLPELLHPDCEWVVQQEWTGYTGFLEEGCDAALFIGMHALAGTPDGVLNHTVSGSEWQNLWFNGTLVGETGINAALCGTWDCRVGLVTGDTAACREAVDLLGDAVVTREGARADRGGREARARRARPDDAVRPGKAMRDPRRVHEVEPRRAVPPPPRRRGRRRAHDRLARRRLVERLAAVLLLGGGTVFVQQP